MSTKSDTFVPLNEGVTYRVEGDTLFLAIPISPGAKAQARLSASGKMRMLGTTHGFQTLPDGSGIRVSLNVGFGATR